VRRHFEEIGEPEINLTPLIDVVFVVLIMFIVVAPLLELDRVALSPGKEEGASIKEASPIAIHVRADNTILVNQRPIHPDNVASWLQEAHANYPGATPQLFHDRAAPFGTYQAIKNAAEQAGYSELDIVLEPA
jgi:biopolymer transport protein ExbD